MADLLRRPQLSYDMLSSVDENRPVLSRRDAETMENEIKYAGIEQVLVSRAKAVYIYLSGSTAYILPARIFSSDSEREEFTEFIKAKHEENKKAG
jgi:hypothetical protein